MTPAEQHAAAHAELDTISTALAHGVTIAPDLIMRMVIATRDRLNRHQPNQIDRFQVRCAYDGRPVPCPEIQGDLKVLGVHVGEDD